MTNTTPLPASPRARRAPTVPLCVWCQEAEGVIEGEEGLLCETDNQQYEGMLAEQGIEAP